MPARTLGHLALYHVPGAEKAARALLEDLGFTLVDNGPAGFSSGLVDEQTANHHDNIVYICEMTAPQWALEQQLRAHLAGDEATGNFLRLVEEWPEAGPHAGIKYDRLEDLEHALAALERDTASGGPLHGQVQVTRFRARPGLDDDVDTRMESSPVFDGKERPAFGDHIIQCFIRTDMFGLLSAGNTIELDYAFPPFFDQVPSFA